MFYFAAIDPQVPVAIGAIGALITVLGGLYFRKTDNKRIDEDKEYDRLGKNYDALSERFLKLEAQFDEYRTKYDRLADENIKLKSQNLELTDRVRTMERKLAKYAKSTSKSK